MDKLSALSGEEKSFRALDNDEEVRQIVTGTYEKIKATLEKKKEILVKVAKVLLEKEVIEGEELRKIIA